MTATRDGVIYQLRFPYADEDDRGPECMTEEQAGALIDKHRDIFEQGVRLGSFNYYIADQINKAERENNHVEGI